MLKHRFSLSTAFALRRALRGALVVLLAMLMTHYFSRTQTFWLSAVAVLLTQAEPGFPIHQGLRRFLGLFLLLLVGGQAVLFLSAPWSLPLVVIAIATVTAYGYSYQSRRYLGLHFPLLALIALLLTLLLPAPLQTPAYLLDILLGAALGLSATVLIFPDKPAQEFPKRMVPLLRSLSAYLAALTALLLREDTEQQQQAAHQRHAVEHCWANKDQTFPVWVFETGFNPALKPGQYYFAVHVGQVTEILFAMHHFARHPFPEDLLKQFAEPIRTATVQSQELLAHIAALLAGNPLTHSQSDFISDLPALEECFQTKIQLSLELLDISRDYVYLAAFIRYLKDLRLQLLQLAATLS